MFSPFALNGGKVAFEYVVNKVDNLFANSRFWVDESHIAKSCLTSEEMRKYANGKEYIGGYHISDLKIYDKPKELGEFYKPCILWSGCKKCKYFRKYLNMFISCDVGQKKPITRPPQNFVYVREEQK